MHPRHPSGGHQRQGGAAGHILLGRGCWAPAHLLQDPARSRAPAALAAPAVLCQPASEGWSHHAAGRHRGAAEAQGRTDS
jgi:hypothetical protein